MALPAPMLRRLLCLLLAEGGRPVSVGRLRAALWEGEPPPSSRKTLQVHVHRLRRELGIENRLRHGPQGYGLTVLDGELDAWRFADLADRGRAELRRGEPGRAAALFREALALWRGAAYDGAPGGPPVAAEAARLEELRTRVHEECAGAELELGRHAELAGELAGLVRQHPYREELRAHLMLALYRSGRRAEGLELFRDTRALFAEHLGIEPGEPLRQLHEAMLRADGGLEGPSRPREALDRSGGPPPRHGALPAQTTSFVGRRAEVDAVGALLAGSRLVTLTGVGGVGKTRLALRVADEAGAGFPDGAWLVELSSVRDGDLVAHAVAQALDLHDWALRTPSEALREHLAARRLLLVLDTCEHLADACALLTETLLQGAPGIRVLATSRESLGVAGEQIYVVPPLPVPSPVPDAAQAGITDAVALFVERARAVDRHFALTPLNRAAVGRLCALLDGIPLAIELAAVRLRSLSVDQVLERLDDRFALLGVGRRTALSRHQTLRTAIEWSHQLCSPAERLLWERLSVFSGGFDGEAARDVCADAELPAAAIPELLAGLVDKSVLLREEDTPGVRLRILDTIREYGADRLRGHGEQDRLRRRHRDHYLALAHRFEDDWYGPRQLVWHRRVLQEHANIRSALDFCLSRPEERRTGLELAGTLWVFWVACGLFTEGRHYLDRLLRLERGPARERLKALWACGHVALGQGDTETVDRVAGECRSLAAGHGDGVAAAFATHLLGAAAAQRGDTAAAVVLAADAVRLSRTLPRAADRERGLAMALVGEAFALLMNGDLDAAAEAIDEQQALSASRGEIWTRSWSSSLRSSVDLARGDAKSAIDHARASLTVRRLLGDTLGMAMCVDTLAHAALASGDADGAARLLAVSRRVWETFGPAQFGSAELRTAQDLCAEQARKLIGDAAYEAAFAAGGALDLEEAISFALGGRPGSPGEPWGSP
ncbi:BTAD domain-containing putative transcriptional regulator [Actinacidiphila glaucinigra]|uniref:BTAD domain-containing putative transcriptional regulator n=1 Tax=Actinacidiphila glaucinigra TaxID=235986 RepID=UPI0033AD1C58